MPAQRFGRDRRVRRHSEFNKAFSAGTRYHGRFVTLVIAANQGTRTRLGLVASRKIGDAVTRNRAKRLIREVFRQQVSTDQVGPAVDIVVIPRREFFEADFAALQQDFRSTLRRSAPRARRDAR